MGYDASKHALKAAQANFSPLPMEAHFERKSLAKKWPEPQGPVWVVMNPPYGQRLGATENLYYLYNAIGQKLQDYANRYQCPVDYSIVSNQVDLLDALHLQYDHQGRLFNGGEQVFARTGQVLPKPKGTAKQPLRGQAFDELKTRENIDETLARRLVKNLKKLEPFLKQPIPKASKKLPLAIYNSLKIEDAFEVSPLRLFRLYDSDIPEYNCSVDVYEHCFYVQEYKAPKSIPEAKAAQRLETLIQTLQAVFHIPAHRIAVRARQRQKGQTQYSRVNPALKTIDQWHKRKDVHLMQEWGATYIVNLGDYMDTGVFLDHRNIRWLFRQLSAGQHVLNLFAYTGAVSLQAAMGGAASTTAVDLSPQYCQWAQHNLLANGLSFDDHQVIRSDVMAWLSSNTNQYDLIFIDPPTFSNSKKPTTLVFRMTMLSCFGWP